MKFVPLFLLLVFSGCFSSDMPHSSMGEGHVVEITNERDFLRHMIPHHQEAVDAANTILQKSANDALKQLCHTIVMTQMSEISHMYEWGKEWYGASFRVASYTPMMRDLTNLEGSELDMAFIQDMIVHHEAAITMAQQVLSSATKKEIQDLAKAIIQSQGEEKRLLESWL